VQDVQMTAGPANESAQNPTETTVAEYVAVEASRLARMASANEFGLLAYLIDMAVLEAWREASEPGRRRRA
jgi:hypothetical protein